MSPPTGVLDAAVIIGLSKGGVFPLLASLYPTLYIPMKVHGLIPRVQPVLDLMMQRGYGIAVALYAKTLQAAGE